MGYITENRLSEIIDVPITLAATQVKQGDWLVAATMKIITPMRLTCRYLTLQLISSSVSVPNIAAGNYVYGSLGLVYVILRKDYSTGNPGVSGGLDTVAATAIGVYARDTTVPYVTVTPGNYSWIVANNMQISTNPTDPISSATSIDFVAALTGTARLELTYT